MKIRIYVDGACSGNPGPGGWAAILFLPESKQEISGYEPGPTTNNRMELRAAMEAMKYVGMLGYKNIEIYSDSAYVVNAIRNKDLKKWAHNGWKTVKYEDVKNQDLWRKMEQWIPRFDKVNFVKIKGHAGVKHNERVDILAKLAIENGRKEVC